MVKSKSRAFDQRGLTLIELLSTLMIVAVLANIAVPSFTVLVQDKKQDAQLSDFKNSVLITRSEAIKRGVPTVICASTNGVTCANASWTPGWVSFVDDNGNDEYDVGEFVIRVNSGLDPGYSLIGSVNVASKIRYQASGDALESGSITLCDPRGVDKAQAIVVSPSGKPKLSDTGPGGAALTCP